MSVLDTADTIRARYEGAAPQLDPEGFRLFRAAGEITGIRNLWEEFPYEDACGRFEEANGHELLRYLTAAHFGAVSWEVVPGTTYERAILREVDTSTEEYQAFARQLYAKALERMGLEKPTLKKEEGKKMSRGGDARYRAIHDIREEERYYPDARAIDPDDLPQFDLLCGGFPCQAFSNAGRRKGFADARGTLFFEIARLAEAKRPRYLLLENVPGLLSHDHGKTFAAILSALDDLGYHVEWTVLNSKHFGVPQSRKRVFLICYLDPRCAGKILPVFGDGGKALIQVLGGSQGHRVYDPEGVACTQTAGGGGLGVKTGLYLIPPAAPFVDLSAGAPHRTDKARCLTARYGQTTLSTHPRERSGVLYIKEATKKGWKAAYPGDTVDLGYAGSNTRRGRVGHDIAHTLETSSIQGIVERGGRIRRLMPRECFRLQGFEDEQIDKILAITSDAQAYKQAGNGVTVNVVEAIGRRIRAVDEQLRKEDAAA